MLREIKAAELFREIKEPVLILKGNEVYRLDEFLDDVRILIDEVRPEPVEEPQPTERRKRRSSEEIKTDILRAYNRGITGITAIMAETGCDYKTVRKYIPISPEG